jgi:hypothetical protein
MLIIATSLTILKIRSRKIVGVKAAMTGQRMQLYAQTRLAGHVSAAHSTPL